MTPPRSRRNAPLVAPVHGLAGVVSPELARMVRRTKLPISVRLFYTMGNPEPIIVIGDHSEKQPFTFGYVHKYTRESAEATAAYTNLRATLERGDAG